MVEAAAFADLARFEENCWWFRGMRRITDGILAGALRGKEVRKALEAGCGTGYYAGYLARRYHWSVYAADLSAQGIRFARNGIRPQFTQADLGVLPYPDGCFNVVTCMDVLPHFRRGAEIAALTELYRVTSPGGLLLLRTAALPCLRSRHSEYWGEQQRFTRQRLIRTVEQAGFRVLRCTYANSLLAPVAFLKFRLWEPAMRKKPASGFKALPRWLDFMLYGCLRLEDLWIRTGMNLPIGQSLIVAARRMPS